GYWHCPFCETLREKAADVCTACGGVTTLTDQSLLFATRRTDPSRLEMAVARIEESLAPQGEHADPYWLGMALLNLRKYSEGLAATKAVPVVFISGKDGFFDKARGRMAGSDAYVTKPFGPDALSRVLQTFVPA